MKEISFMDYPQHGEVFYFYGQALPTSFNRIIIIISLLMSPLLGHRAS
jgi:hypothetical protein